MRLKGTLKALVIFLVIISGIEAYQLLPIDTISKIPTQSNKISELNKLSRTVSEEQPEKAIDYGRQALELSFELDDQAGVAESYLSIGGGLENLGIYDKSLEYYLKSLRIYETLQSPDKLAYTLDIIGYIYWYLKIYDKSHDYYDRSLIIAREIGDSIRIADNLNHKGLSYWKQNNYESALKCYNEGLKISTSINYVHGISTITNNVATIYLDQGLLNDALQKYEESLKMKLEKESSRKWGITEALTNVGNIYTRKGEYRKAYEKLTEANELAKSIKSKVLLIENYESFAEYYERIGNYNAANDYLKLSAAAKDSLFTETKSHKIAEIQALYLLESKENEIRQLNLDKQYKDSEIQFQREINSLYIILLVVSISGGIIIYMFQKSKSRAYKKLVHKNIEVIESEKKLRKLRQFRETNKFSEIDETADEEEIKNPNEMTSEKEKYSASPLTDEQKDLILDAINNAIEKEKIFRQTDLTINKLADHLHVSRTYVSQVINEKIGKSFIQFINEHRVTEACIMLADKGNRLFTMEHIASEVGFNSITSYNRAFKKVAGVTPSFYLKSLPEDFQPHY